LGIVCKGPEAWNSNSGCPNEVRVVVAVVVIVVVLSVPVVVLLVVLLGHQVLLVSVVVQEFVDVNDRLVVTVLVVML